MDELLAQCASLPGSRVLPPAGLPTLAASLVFPPDLRQFYESCGGLTLFGGSAIQTEIVPPRDFVKSNVRVAGVLEPAEDISDAWYVLADCGGGQYVSVDMSPDRLGRCYDSFWDRHAVAGSSSIIAWSVAEFLYRSIHAKEVLYWLEPSFATLGDAYGPTSDP